MLEPFNSIDALVGPMGRPDPPKVVRRLRYEERGDNVYYANIYGAEVGYIAQSRTASFFLRSAHRGCTGLAIIRRK